MLGGIPQNWGASLPSAPPQRWDTVTFLINAGIFKFPRKTAKIRRDTENTCKTAAKSMDQDNTFLIIAGGAWLKNNYAF